MIAHCLSNTRTANPGATATSKAKMTKGHIAPLDADEDQSLETYCFSFLSLLYHSLDVGGLFSPSFFSDLTLDPLARPRPIQRLRSRTRNYRKPLSVSSLSHGTSSDSLSSLDPLSHEPFEEMSRFRRKRTHEQPEDTTTPSGRGEEHHS